MATYICSPDTIISCPDGEIGRRTVFRSQRRQRCAGSNPVLGTKELKAALVAVFLFYPCGVRGSSGDQVDQVENLGRGINFKHII